MAFRPVVVPWAARCARIEVQSYSAPVRPPEGKYCPGREKEPNISLGLRKACRTTRLVERSRPHLRDWNNVHCSMPSDNGTHPAV
jgi:hypothetical protein